MIHSMKRANSGLANESPDFSISMRNFFYHSTTIALSVASGLYIGVSSDYEYLGTPPLPSLAS
jgi:hypothetical protein